MSNVRIRYMKEGNLLVSNRVFSVNINNTETAVKIVLDKSNMKFSIIDASNVDVKLLSGGNTKNLSVLKIQAKKGLQKLGYSFSTETRVKTQNVEESTNTKNIETLLASSLNG